MALVLKLVVVAVAGVLAVPRQRLAELVALAEHPISKLWYCEKDMSDEDHLSDPEKLALWHVGEIAWRWFRRSLPRLGRCLIRWVGIIGALLTGTHPWWDRIYHALFGGGQP